jgi:hypothetical protein
MERIGRDSLLITVNLFGLARAVGVFPVERIPAVLFGGVNDRFSVGRPDRNLIFTLVGDPAAGADGTARFVLTNNFGYYNFVEIEAGQTVIISVRAKQITFSQPTLVLNVSEDTGEINFVSI